MTSIWTPQFLLQLANMGIATLFAVVLLFVVVRSMPVLSDTLTQIKIFMIQMLEVLNSIKQVMPEIKELLAYFKHTRD